MQTGAFSNVGDLVSVFVPVRIMSGSQNGVYHRIRKVRGNGLVWFLSSHDHAYHLESSDPIGREAGIICLIGLDIHIYALCRAEVYVSFLGGLTSDNQQVIAYISTVAKSSPFNPETDVRIRPQQSRIATYHFANSLREERPMPRYLWLFSWLLCM